MNLRNILYAGLMAASVGCGESRTERHRRYCEEELTDAAKVAQETGSAELTKTLNSKQWCKTADSEGYWSDWQALGSATYEGYRDYCNQKGFEARKLVPQDKFSQLVFEKNFSCDGKNSRNLIIQTRELQQIIDSYQKK